MNLIQYLQQGGFILPQYTQSNLSYEVPQAGNQAIDRMNQYAQQDMQNYIGLESLNISRKQADTSYFNSMIQNKLAIEREDRINKQTDLNNKKLELDQFKAINSMLDEEMKFDKDNFLNRDRAALDKLYKDQGADMETLLKNPNDLNSLSKGLSLRKQIKMGYKTAWDNKMAVDDAQNMLDESEKYEKYLNDLEAKGVPIDIKAKVAFTEGRRDAYNELIGFKQGKVGALNMQGKHWQSISAMPDFINEVEQQIQTDLDRKTQAIKDQAEFAEAQNKLATANLNIAKTESEIAGRPYEEMKKNMDALTGIAKYAPTLSILADAFPGADLTKPMNVLEAMNKATPTQLEKLNKALAKMDDETKDHHHTSLNGALADCIVRGCSPEKIAQLKEGIRLSQTSNSNMNYSGIPEKQRGEEGTKVGKTYEYDSYSVDVSNPNNIKTFDFFGSRYEIDDLIGTEYKSGVRAGFSKTNAGVEGAFLHINLNHPKGKQFIKDYGYNTKKTVKENAIEMIKAWSLKTTGVAINDVQAKQFIKNDTLMIPAGKGTSKPKSTPTNTTKPSSKSDIL